jgi:hypothetical protein
MAGSDCRHPASHGDGLTGGASTGGHRIQQACPPRALWGSTREGLPPGAGGRPLPAMRQAPRIPFPGTRWDSRAHPSLRRQAPKVGQYLGEGRGAQITAPDTERRLHALGHDEAQPPG